LAAQARVQRVAQPVADQAQREDGQGDRDAGHDREVGRAVQVLVGVLQQGAPARGGRRHTKSQEAEPGLGQHGETNTQRQRHDHGRRAVRPDVPEQDSTVAGADRPRREDVVQLAYREHLRTHEAREESDAADADRDHERVDAAAQCRKQPQRQDQTGEGEQHLHAAHNDFVNDAAEEAGDQPEDDADGGAERRGDNANAERHTGAVKHAAQQVTAEHVGTEQMLR